MNNIVIEDCQGNGLHISTYDPNSERINVSNMTIINCAHGRKNVSTRSAAVVLRGGHINITNINITDSDRGFHIDGEGIVNLKPIKITNANVENASRQGVITRDDSPVTYFLNSSFDGGSNSYAIRARNEIHFANCAFKKQSVSPACVSLEDNAHNSTFSNCTFEGGSPSINIVTNGTKITNSTFSHFPLYGLVMNNVDSLNVNGNIIKASDTTQGVYFKKVTHSAFSMNNFNKGTMFFKDSTFNHSNIITNNIFNNADGTVDSTTNIYEYNFIG